MECPISLTPLILICDLILGKYGYQLFGAHLPVYALRNFLFRGIPYFCIGKILFEQKDRIIKCYAKNKILTWVFAIAFAVLNLLERYLIVNNYLSGQGGFYISTIFLSVTIFIIAISTEPNKQLNIIESFLASIGRKYATLIYILHPIVIWIINYARKKLGIDAIYLYVATIAVFFLTVFGAWCINKTQGILGKLLKKNDPI